MTSHGADEWAGMDLSVRRGNDHDPSWFKGLDGLADEYDMIIIGAGISGCVFAERGSKELGLKSLIIDKRDHIGGGGEKEKEKERGRRGREKRRLPNRTPQRLSIYSTTKPSIACVYPLARLTSQWIHLFFRDPPSLSPSPPHLGWWGEGRGCCAAPSFCFYSFFFFFTTKQSKLTTRGEIWWLRAREYSTLEVTATTSSTSTGSA